MKRTFVVISAVLALASGFTAEVFGQTGQVVGQVTAARDGDFLPGAQVSLQGTSLGAVTDRNGFYRIAGVPAGSHTLVVTYLGYEDFRAGGDARPLMVSSTE